MGRSYIVKARTKRRLRKIFHGNEHTRIMGEENNQQRSSVSGNQNEPPTPATPANPPIVIDERPTV